MTIELTVDELDLTRAALSKVNDALIEQYILEANHADDAARNAWLSLMGDVCDIIAKIDYAFLNAVLTSSPRRS
jgi:hypothetical protein